MNPRWLIAGYLLAIVLGNIAATLFGPWATPAIGFICIGLDLTTRDALHEAWRGRVARNMALLILAGALLSILTCWASPRIASASAVAFTLAATVDTLVFIALHQATRFWRVNGSNMVAAVVDSLLFPLLAFGSWMPEIVAAQWLAKVGGGLFWSLVLMRFTQQSKT